MHQGKLVFSQLMAHLPLSTFRRCVAACRGEHKVQDFSCLDQFLAMAFAQLTYRHEIPQILSLAMFLITPINQLLTPPSTDSDPDFEHPQLVLL